MVPGSSKGGGGGTVVKAVAVGSLMAIIMSTSILPAGGVSGPEGEHSSEACRVCLSSAVREILAPLRHPVNTNVAVLEWQPSAWHRHHHACNQHGAVAVPDRQIQSIH